MAQQFFTRKNLSGASNGSGVLIPEYATTTAGSIRIHNTSASEYDEIWLYAANQGTVIGTLNLWWAQTVSGGVGTGAGTGGYNQGGSLISYSIASGSGLTLVIPGLILGPGLYLNGSSTVDNSVMVVYGFVNHIGPSM